MSESAPVRVLIEIPFQRASVAGPPAAFRVA